jgi:glycosyltransferase involved in cell wall biosynthesis/cephalosporin hydroxylase
MMDEVRAAQLVASILDRVVQVEGWLDEHEAVLLMKFAVVAVVQPELHAVVEVGSYHGRSTIALASIVRAARPEAKVYAIDPHRGEISYPDSVHVQPSSWDAFCRNIAAADLLDTVEPIRKRSYEVAWDRPIGLLFIDGLHDYSNVARDLNHFEKHIVPGGYVVFDDYHSDYPGVVTFVDELVRSGRYRVVENTGRLMVTERTTTQTAANRSWDAYSAREAEEMRLHAPGHERASLLLEELTRRELALRRMAVEEVSLCTVDEALLYRVSLDFPKPGTLLGRNALDVGGWILGGSTRVVAVEFVYEGETFRRVFVNRPRPDVVAAYPNAPDAKDSGFHARLAFAGLTSWIISLQAVLTDQRRVPFATILCAEKAGGDDTADEVPLVSVIIPCFNQSHFLADAIESVLGQSHTRFEVVVIDDGGTDNAAAVARRYPGVRFIRRPHAGVAAARNAGIEQSRGEYLVFLDADDRLLPNALETGLVHLKAHPEAGFVCGNFRRIAVDGSISDHQSHNMKEDCYFELLRRNRLPTTGLGMYRRSVFDTVGGFDPSMSPAEDYDLYLRIARKYPVVCHPIPVSEYRRHGTNASRDAAVTLKAMRAVLHAQWPHVRNEPRYRRAYKEGVRNACDYYGQQLIDQIHELMRARRWVLAARRIGALLLLHPRGVISLWSDWRL